MPDCNSDRSGPVFSLQILAASRSKKQGQPAPNSRADLNQDRRANIYNLQQLPRCFGWNVPSNHLPKPTV